jgi:hypothetical protein
MVNIFIKLLEQPDIQKNLVKLSENYTQNITSINNRTQPFTNYSASNTNQGDGLVIITGRFRSGSTLLWNLFRQSNEFTAFYEPFNERQWFNSSMRGINVDNTHRGVSDYWAEYENFDELIPLYNEDWIRKSLYMNGSYYEPKMREFIDKIIEKSENRTVLQFNRIDFRIEWFKKQYPLAKIIHLYRSPRDQWCSFLSDKTLMNQHDVEYTYQDSFYLDVWCEDLYKQFPFLHKSVTPHPYMRFYYLWKLSYIFGIQYADISLSYEELVIEPKKIVENLRECVGFGADMTENAASLINVTSLGAWTKYAFEDWFFEKEQACEIELEQFLLSKL